MLVLARKCDDRPMAALTYARGNKPDYSLVPGRLVYANTVRPALLAQLIDESECLFTHRRLNIPPLAIDLIQQARVFTRRLGVIREEALDADRDILEPPSGIDARADSESQIGANATRHGSARLF